MGSTLLNLFQVQEGKFFPYLRLSEIQGLTLLYTFIAVFYFIITSVL